MKTPKIFAPKLQTVIAFCFTMTVFNFPLRAQETKTIEEPAVLLSIPILQLSACTAIERSTSRPDNFIFCFEPFVTANTGLASGEDIGGSETNGFGAGVACRVPKKVQFLAQV